VVLWSYPRVTPHSGHLGDGDSATVDVCVCAVLRETAQPAAPRGRGQGAASEPGSGSGQRRSPESLAVLTAMRGYHPRLARLFRITNRPTSSGTNVQGWRQHPHNAVMTGPLIDPGSDGPEECFFHAQTLCTLRRASLARSLVTWQIFRSCMGHRPSITMRCVEPKRYDTQNEGPSGAEVASELCLCLCISRGKRGRAVERRTGP
jgi:hypothetical protein